jgi:hypothetical protein
VAQVDDKKVNALDKALKAIKRDAAAFKSDPKGMVPDLDDQAAAVFKSMETTELTQLLEVDGKMHEAGFTIGAGGASVRMV